MTSTISLCMLLLFALFLVLGVWDVEASRRLCRTKDPSSKSSQHFKVHNSTLMDGGAAASIDSESPPPLNDSVSSPPPLPGVTETFGGPVALTSRILNSPPSELVPDKSGGSSSGASNVVVFVILILVLIGLISTGIWFSCFRSQRHEEGSDLESSTKSRDAAATMESEHGSCPHVRTNPSTPMANGREGRGSVPAQSSATPIPNERRGRGSAQPSAAPMPNERGGRGSVPAQPLAAPIPNERGGRGSVPAQPSAAPIPNERGGRGSVLAQPPAAPMPNERGGRGSVPAQPPAPRRDQRDAHPNSRPSRVADFGLIAFTYKELRDATDNFSETNFLGEGGFAIVYKGSLSGNKEVAVKLLKKENSTGENEFQNEVDIMSRVRHINIVSLIGYCITVTKRLIVYEFVENKSLHDHLRGGNNLQFMDWAIRMKIAQGAAKGLAYLHGECGTILISHSTTKVVGWHHDINPSEMIVFAGPQNIIHRDVKPANILLDSSFVAKVADFGIAKLCPNSFDSYIATYVIGSVGFIDPFYYETKELSFKSDVYSFGVVLLELISGVTHLPIVQELKYKLPRALKSGNFKPIADPKLENYDLDDMTLMITCVQACLQRDPKDRPQMNQVSQVLERIISADKLKMRTRPNRGF